MRLERAIEVAHTLRRQHGEGTHCNASDCSICVCLVMAAHIKNQNQAAQTVLCECGNRKIDGICGRCDR